MVVRASLVALVLAVSSCTSVSVTTDAAEDVDFSAYRTFDWMPVPAGLYAGARVGPTLDNRIRRAVETQLVLKGLQQVLEGQKPDLLIAYHASARETFDRAYYDSWGYGRLGRWRGGTVVVDTQTEGSLVVDLIDAPQNALVWRGKASGVISNPRDAEKRVFEAVERIFTHYPPS